MITRSSILHLRLPFSFFLLPIFLFATYHSVEVNTTNFWILFFVLHLLIYPASNGYNSFFDKDEGSIGGLENPPTVTPDLFLLVNILDLVGVILSFGISFWVGSGVLLYVLISRSYSHPKIRLKKYPLIGLLSVAIFQGYLIFIITVLALTEGNLKDLVPMDHLGGLISTLFLFGSYPMTQIYQHDQDRKSGDQTISLRLGVKGTFLFTGIFFAFTMGLFFLYFSRKGMVDLFFWELGFLAPVFLFFSWWQFRVMFKNVPPDFRNTMRLNLISSFCLSGFFLFAYLVY